MLGRFSREETGVAGEFFFVFVFFFKIHIKFKGKMTQTSRPALWKAILKGHNLKSCYKNSVICFN